MMTKKLTVIAIVLSVLAGCASIEESKMRKTERENYQNPFYLKYLSPDSALDQAIYRRIEALRQDRNDPTVHNELGALLFERRFNDQALEEFELAIDLDKKFYPAFYNIGLLRLVEGDLVAARRAFKKTISIKPGHPEAQFHLGLTYEMSGRDKAAIEHYVKAASINYLMLDPSVNPRVVDSSLISQVMLTMYESKHAEAATRFSGPHPDYYVTRATEEAAPAEPVDDPDVPTPQPVKPAPSVRRGPTVMPCGRALESPATLRSISR